MRRILATVFIAALAAPLWGQGITVTPSSWEFGFNRRGSDLTTVIELSNTGSAALSVDLIPTCACLTANPAQLVLQPRDRAAVTLAFDTSAYSGEVTKTILIRAPGVKPVIFSVHGVVKGAERLESAAVQPGEATASTTAAASPADAAAPRPRIELTYYYAPGCRTCERFLSQEIPRLEKAVGAVLAVRTRDVLDSDVYQELTALAASQGAPVTAIPVMDVRGRLLQGEEEISRELEGILAAADGGQGAPAAAADTETKTVVESLAALPVLAGGLLDGVNPCAFTTLIFLLASLALAGRGRREVLVIGALFTAAVFLTYLGIGLGFFAALRAVSSFALVSVILRWILVAALLVFAGLSVYDFFVIRSGRPTEILLQLPTVLKRRIHATIRTRVRSAALAGSSLVLGFLVSIFEFACTGQVYLPTLAWLVRMKHEPSALALLVLYNLGFIAPLMVVFAASWLGVGSKRITLFFQKHMAAVKMGLAVFFLGLAAFTLLG